MSRPPSTRVGPLVLDAHLPTADEETVQAIDAFLRHFLERIDRSLSEHRVLAQTDRTDRLKGILAYQRHQVSTLRSLISSNLSRGKRESSRRPRQPR